MFKPYHWRSIAVFDIPTRSNPSTRHPHPPTKTKATLMRYNMSFQGQNTNDSRPWLFAIEILGYSFLVSLAKIPRRRWIGDCAQPAKRREWVLRKMCRRRGNALERDAGCSCWNQAGRCVQIRKNSEHESYYEKFSLHKKHHSCMDGYLKTYTYIYTSHLSIYVVIRKMVPSESCVNKVGKPTNMYNNKQYNITVEATPISFLRRLGSQRHKKFAYVWQ